VEAKTSIQPIINWPTSVFGVQGSEPGFSTTSGGTAGNFEKNMDNKKTDENYIANIVLQEQTERTNSLTPLQFWFLPIVTQIIIT
jgi:hypothetical protein